jgi:ABC-2 type transport system ATP-binding protein
MARDPAPPTLLKGRTMTEEAVLQIYGLSKDYGDAHALRPTSLEVGRGELVMLVGANGAGKSTLLSLCAGLLEPTAGNAAVAGAPVGSIAARRATSYVPDAPVLYDDLSVREHLEYIAGLHESEGWQPRAAELLALFELEDRADDLPGSLSRGLKQKAALVVSLVRPFDLLLVDEPYVGLDAPAQRAITDYLGGLSGAGRAVVVATHQLDLAGRATRCIALRDGAVIHDGAPNEKDIWSWVTG